MTYKTFFGILFSINSIFCVYGQEAQISPFDNLKKNTAEIVRNAIEAKAFPGCVVYVQQSDSLLLHQAYGYHTYDSIQPVQLNSIYDIASITKVTASTLAIMKMYEDGLISLEDKIGDYVHGLGKMGEVTIREALAHQGGIKSWIRFYESFRKKNGKFKRNTILNDSLNSDFFAIDENQYLHPDIYKRIKKEIRMAEVSKEPVYTYSGLFFYLVPELVENLTSISFESYLNQYFYQPLQSSSLRFNPLMHYDKDQIVPTEIDTFFRMSSIHGKVHDEGAILMGGLSGNAGLFSNAEHLARVWQMFLNDGFFDSVQYLKPSTIQLFTSYQYPNLNNRRGLGFDKPLLEYDEILSSVSKDASIASYGHTGYTGVMVWADPEYDLLFIFLTNRVYPNRTYRNIYKLNVRPKLHQLFYDFILKDKP